MLFNLNIAKWMKLVVMVTLIVLVAGFCTWLISKWFTMNKPIPDGAIKVWGTFINMC